MLPVLLLLLVTHFNSIKVQLELAGAGSMLGGLLFQFHKGTIRTYGFSVFLLQSDGISIP